jgi:hypothetical protein
MASGFGMAFTKAMLSSIFLTCVYSARRKSSNASVHRPDTGAKGATWDSVHEFTVIIGSRGPNISSVMTAESSGGFSSIVGSMYLGQFRQRTMTLSTHR